jgi:hypothetical protein
MFNLNLYKNEPPIRHILLSVPFKYFSHSFYDTSLPNPIDLTLLFFEEKSVIPEALAVGVHHASGHLGFHFIFNAQCVEELLEGIQLADSQGLLDSFDLDGCRTLYRSLIDLVGLLYVAFLQTVVKPHGIVGHPAVAITKASFQTKNRVQGFKEPPVSGLRSPIFL